MVFPNDANPLGNAMGGRVRHWIDICAAVAAGRHARTPVVTASVDQIDFLHPVRVGSVLVLEFRRAGYQLAVPVRHPQPTPGQIPAGAFVGTADLTSEAQTQAFVGRVLERFGRSDVLVHTAGGFDGGKPLEAVTLSDWHRMCTVNVETAVVAIRSVHRFRTAQDVGRLISCPLPRPFHTGHLADGLSVARWIAQRIAYCLRKIGTVQEVGKQGNARLYEFACGPG